MHTACDAPELRPELMRGTVGIDCGVNQACADGIGKPVDAGIPERLFRLGVYGGDQKYSTGTRSPEDGSEM